MPEFNEAQPLGNWVRDHLSRHGITEEKATRLARKLGFSGCWCGRIRRWLNRRRWLTAFFRCLGARVQYHGSELW
jgi:hypothetical protein